MNKNIYVTTAIPYVNGRPHVGFALELVQADALARYHRLIGNPVRFQTGTDENALKNVLSAREKGVRPQEFVDAQSALFADLCRALHISCDRFIRTTSPAHRDFVSAFWRQLRADDVYIQRYAGLYCVGCEDFYLERDLVDGVCPDHGKPPVRIEEENYFFRLSRYQAEIEDLIASNRLRVVPEERRNEVLEFIRRGLRDISISRPAARSEGWGIPVPGDPAHVVYVWIDALINYLSGLGAQDQFWTDAARKIHFIGKNVWKFHAVYWPALLLSAGLPLPDEIFVHGFLTENGKKISKSAGAAIDPQDCIDRFGADGVRFYLLKHVLPWSDSDFSIARLEQVYNTELANGLGNLVSRLLALCRRAGGFGSLPPCAAGAVNSGSGDTRSPGAKGIPEAPAGYHEALADYEFDRALSAIWALVDFLNRDIDHKKPWNWLKTGDTGPLQLALIGWLAELRRIVHWLAPFLPETAGKIAVALQKPENAAEILFPRIDIPGKNCA